MLAHASMLLTFRCEAFLTSTLLINWLPSTVLHDKSHMKQLVNRQLNLQKLRIFGCICYPYMRHTILINFGLRLSDAFIWRLVQPIKGTNVYVPMKKLLSHAMFNLMRSCFLFSQVSDLTSLLNLRHLTHVCTVHTHMVFSK